MGILFAFTLGDVGNGFMEVGVREGNKKCEIKRKIKERKRERKKE